MNKTRLMLTLTNDMKMSLTPYNVETISNKTHSNMIYSIPYTTGDMECYTDLFVACCEKYIPMIVYTSLKTVYSNAPHSKIKELMDQAVNYSIGTNRKQDDYLEYLESHIDEYINPNYSDTERDTQIEFARERRIKYEKIHKFKMVTGSDGKRHRVEVIPYTTEHWTVYGRESMNININVGSDCEDLIQTAYKAVCELLSLGLIKSINDFWNYRNYYYKCLNKAIMSSRAFSIRVQDIEPYMIKGVSKRDSTQESMIISVENKVSRDTLLSTLINTVLDNCDKQCNTKMIKTVFYMHFVGGMSTRDIADRIGKRQTQVMRYINTVKKALNNDSVHTMLTELNA